MAYHCPDCSYTGTKRSASGFCPACGSSNFKRAGRTDGSSQNTAEKRRGKLVLLVLLWAFLIAHIYWKLNY